MWREKKSPIKHVFDIYHDVICVAAVLTSLHSTENVYLFIILKMYLYNTFIEKN